MNLATLSAGYLRARPLQTCFAVALLALGIAAMTLLLLVVEQVEQRMGRDAQGVDLVVGAKGSPVQLVLSGIYHLDVPTGNIPLRAVAELSRDRRVREAIPLSLGDSFRGFRIVGATGAYVSLYGAEVAEGRIWGAPMEAVVGADVAARTGIAVGQSFVGVHGIGESSADAHDSHPYRVVGRLARSGTVLDRLVLTSLESVWIVHEAHHEPADQAERDALAGDREVTVVLLRYSTPLAAATLPRQINAGSDYQAASPAYETVRLFRLLGIGVEALRGLAGLLILAAGFSVFVALTQALEERRTQLAIMRVLGASPATVFGLLILEGCMLAAAGTGAGLLAGHGLAALSGWMMPGEARGLVSAAAWHPDELAIAGFGLGVGLLAALLPAWRASRADVPGILSESS